MFESELHVNDINPERDMIRNRRNRGTFGATRVLGILLPEPPVEESTSGMEDIVDWDVLEEGLLEGRFASKETFRKAVTDMYDKAGVDATKHARYIAVQDGLCNLPAGTKATDENEPQHHALMVRAIYDALPDRGVVSVSNVREIRRRRAAGELLADIAADLGLNKKTVSDVSCGKTYKDVA